MRLIEVNDEKYQVLKEIHTIDDDFVSKITEMYKERYNDFFLLKAVENPAVQPHFLICRKIDDIEFEPINNDADVTVV